MNASLFACLGLAISMSCIHAQSSTGRPTAAIRLFDGKSLAGWHPENDAAWTVANGALICDQSGDGWLRSDGVFSDFVLQIEFRNSPGGNSGIFFRASKASKAGDPPNPADGYELQINNEDPKWATGSIEDVIQRIAPVNPAPNQWHMYTLDVRGDHFIATLDGKKTLDGHDSTWKSGHIGLQHHKNMKIEFRNIKIQALPTK